MASKTRSDASPLNQFQERLDDWLYIENASFQEVSQRLARDHSFMCSPSSVWRWKQRRDEERLLEQITNKARQSREVVAKFAEENPELDASFTNLLRQVAMDLVSSPNPDPQAICLVAGKALKLRDQDLQRKKLELSADKFRASLRTKLEEGLDELAKTIGSNPEARALYDSFRAVVTKATA